MNRLWSYTKARLGPKSPEEPAVEPGESKSIPSSNSFLGNTHPIFIAAANDEMCEKRYENLEFKLDSQDQDPEQKAFYVLFLEKLRNKFRVNISNLKAIGQGGFGKVFEANSINDARKKQMKFAIKVVFAEYRGPNYLSLWYSTTKKELYFLSKLRHPNIIKLHDFMWLHNKAYGPKLCLLAMQMEYMPMDLNAVLWWDGALEPYLLNRMVVHVSSALEYMRKRGVAHQDIKTANIMLRLPTNYKDYSDKYEQSEFVVIDLGLAKRYSKAIETERVGSDTYWSPEKLDTSKSFEPFSADCYALGVVTLKCMMGNKLSSNAGPADYLKIVHEHIASVERLEPVHRVVQLLLLPECDRLKVNSIGKIMR